jgi:two-component system, OmpR family, phosphate regulon sensor histidine kinase PhoR
MKTFSPRQLAIFISILITVLSGAFQVAIIYLPDSDVWKFLVITVLSVFIVSYVTTYYILKNFIVNKIKPIYKTIHNINIPDDEMNEKFEDRDIIGMVAKEVSDWANTKTKQISQLRQMEKYRKEFLGNVSHELKTPIFNVQGYVLTLLDGALEDEKINRMYLERTEKSINRLISIVEDLEAISKLETGQLELHFENFDIVQLVKEVYEMQEIRARKYNISLKFGANYDKPIKVKADKKQIFQVITNLVVNSVKYGSMGGVTKIDFFDMDANILIEVADNGIGIEEKNLHRLFERFYRIDKSRSREMGGTGLGLSIVKHILEAHNQRINVRSKHGEGTTFAFTLTKV